VFISKGKVAMPDLPSGTVTFIFADLEDGDILDSGGTDNYAAAFRRAVQANGGHIYKKVGNAFQAAFPTAGMAVDAAAQAQRELQISSGSPQSLISNKARMALHSGVTDIRDGGYVGPLLNRVARLLAAANGGQVLLTEATAELLRDYTMQGVSLRDLGDHRLKDLTRPERIYQLDYDPLLVFPALRTLGSRPNNLPVQPTPLIGREAVVEAVRAELLRGDTSLLTLLGPGGIGKTRLGLQVAAELLDDFSDGVFFVNLAPISDTALVPASIGQALGVVETGTQALFDALTQHLRDKRLLLVLDNFEQLLQAGPGLAELLAGAPGLKALVTSRAALRLSIEREYIVPALPVPARGTSLTTEEAKGYEAVALFVSRAQSVRADFSVSDLNKEAIIEICRRLDGLPLAIELAAARTRVLGPEAILARLAPGGVGKLLTGGTRDMPARQQTLQATIEWSYNLLGAGEQTLFNGLGIFVGGHTLEAAEAVAGITNYEFGGADSLDVLEGVTALADNSLVYSREVDGETRFFMLETLREFALERLRSSGEEEKVARAHTLYCLELAESAEPNLTGAAQGQWLARLETEHDNLRAALDRLAHAAAGPAEGDDERSPTELGRLSGALWRFWFRRGHMTEGRRRLAEALRYGEHLPPPVRAKVLHGLGVLAYEQGDYPQAESYFEESLALRRELGDKMGMIASLNNLANVALFGSDYSSAAVRYEEALLLARELGDDWSIAITLGNKGWVEMNKGDYDQAAALYEESLALRRIMGDEWGMGNALDNLAWARTYQGRFAEAKSLAESSITIFEKLGDKDSISDLLDILGRCALGEGDYIQARVYFHKSLTLNRELEDKAGSALSLLGLAALAEAQGEWEQAARLFGAADALRASTAGFQRYYFRQHEARVREHLGEDAFDRLSGEGRSMTLEQISAYAGQPSSEARIGA
jgi:predicted ATPase/class 3 adenylate cyclase/Tfp pilus assembly protein PilF